jgi:hypothetical protein
MAKIPQNTAIILSRWALSRERCHSGGSIYGRSNDRRRAVILIENMGDKLDFLAILLGLGIQLHADARIQV